MRILLSFLQDRGNTPYNIPAYRFWSHYIKNGIEEAGMTWTEVPEVDWAAGLVPYENDPALNTWKEQTWDKTIKYIETHKQDIDIFLCYLYPKQIDINAIKQIRDMGIPCVNFYCDHIRQFTKVPAEFKVFDLIWVPEFEALAMYESDKINHIHLPMPIWVDPGYRSCPKAENTNISFIGSKDALRANLLSEIISQKIPVEIRGSGWATPAEQTPDKPAGLTKKIVNQITLLRRSGIGGFAAYHRGRLVKTGIAEIPVENIFDKPDFENYINITRQSMIILGINRVPAYKNISRHPLAYSRLRDLEAPMLGACYLTEYTQGVAALYNIGSEIETYANTGELIYKCRELAGSKAKRKELRQAGQKRALTSHGIPQSLNKLELKLFH